MRVLSILPRTVLVLSLALLLGACGGPSDEVLKKAITEKHPAIAYGGVSLGAVQRSNEYTRKREGETFHVVEYDADVIYPSGRTETLHEQVTLVHRGHNWYLTDE